MTLTKRELVMRISEETGLNQAQVVEVVQKTLNYITEALAKGGNIRTARHRPAGGAAEPDRGIVHHHHDAGQHCDGSAA
jgi:hypothetical protein